MDSPNPRTRAALQVQCAARRLCRKCLYAKRRARPLSCVAQLKEAVLTIDFMYETGPGRPLQTGGAPRPPRKCQKHKQSAGNVDHQFPGAVIDDVSFVDCIFRGVRSTEVVEASGSILF